MIISLVQVILILILITKLITNTNTNIGIFTVSYGGKEVDTNDTNDDILFSKTDTFSDIEDVTTNDNDNTNDNNNDDDFKGSKSLRNILQACVLPYYNNNDDDDTTTVTIDSLTKLMNSNNFNFTL